ncbi:LRR and PYD domains-containing 3-like protein [Labeo rohita]|uniref:LRR and PYD domains-containing 3-like protein n=1 Tax=Labeo rohita TaxID=84645 RepID=A0A498N373_LABRO|nr:LRR and PYD domains-containing 3-like protein [Labeo rohita]
MKVSDVYQCFMLPLVLLPRYKKLSDSCKLWTKYLLPDALGDLATHYTEPVLIKRSKEQTEKYCQEYVKSVHASGTGTSSQLLSNDINHSIRIDQLFSPDCDGNTPKTVILVGDSGKGKTFMLQKIMWDWASEELYTENFDAVFLLKFDELKCISEEMSLNELLSWSCSLTSDQILEILKLTPEKVLILIDGIDEFSYDPHIQMSSPTDPSQKAPIMDILNCLLRDLLLLESPVIVTSRYTVAAELSNLFKRPQRFTEIVGFSERGVEEYFQKFFQNEKLFRKSYESVKANESLLAACSVPLLCWMVCLCLKKYFIRDDHVMRELKTTTSIYVHFVSTLLEHHDQSQSVLTMLRSLGQLAEEGVKKQQVLFDENRVAKTGLDPAVTPFLYKYEKFFKLYSHFSFQEFFTALYYVLLDEEESWCKASELFNLMESEAIIYRSSPIFRGRLSNPIPSVMMFLCGLFNEKVSSSIFKKIKCAVPQIIKMKKKQLKEKLMEKIPAMTRQYGLELFALHCLYELQDERLVAEALKTHRFIDLSNVSLRSTDCWVLLYCLQCCPHIRDLNLMYCDLTAEKLKILQPALCMCENMRISVEHLSEVGDLIQILGEAKILGELKVQEDEYSAESPRWSLDLSVTCGDVSLSLTSSEKNPSFPAVLNISLKCPQSEISSTDWTLFFQRLSRARKLAKDSSALDEYVSLLLSSFHSVGLKMLNLKLVVLNQSWASGIISLVQTCNSLQELSVSVSGLLLEEGLMLLKKSLMDPHCTVIIEGTEIFIEKHMARLTGDYSLDRSDMILHYKASIIDKCKVATAQNLPCVDLAACYTEPVIIQRSKEQTEKYYREHVRSVNASSHLLSNDKNHSINIDQLFSPDCDGNKPKTVILSGDSGKGKSFMLQKIMLGWASGELYSENFDVMFLFKCEELKCIFEEMNLFELLSWSCILTSDQISQILHLTPEKVLILIDGIDEYVSHPPSHSMLQLTNPSDRARPTDILRSVLKGILLPESFILVTTRAIAADAVMNLLKGPQRLTEIMGFSEKGVQEYFQKFFQDEELFRSLKANESLLTACSVPLLCWMVCFLLKKHFTGVMRELKTTTSIYVHFVSSLLEHHGHSQSVLTMLRSLGQRAEEGMRRQEGLFVKKSLTVIGLDPATNVFLYKDSLERNSRQVPVFKFMHLSFQQFFTGLYYVLLHKEQSCGKVTELLNSLKSKRIINRPSPERRSNPIPSVVMFLCGLLNKKASSSLFEMINWTVPHTIMLKEKLLESVLTMRKQHGCELFALHCLYELQDEEFVRRALGDWVSIDLSNVSLRSTDCCVLLYCLQCCAHIRDLNLMYCDLTAEKLKILQPALCICETMRLSVEHLSEVGDLIQILGESKILRELKVQEDENSAESPRWSLNLSITRGDVLLSLNSSEKNPSFPTVLNISLTCPQTGISRTDWTLFLQRLSKKEKLAEDSSALDEHVSLLLSSFHSVGLKTLDLKLVSLNESWASGIISLVQTCTSLQQLSVCADLLLEDGIMLLKKSLTDPHCTVIIEGFGSVSTEMSKHNSEGQSRKPRKGCSDTILHYKASVIDKYKFVTECNLPSDERVELAGRYTEPVIVQKSKVQNEQYYREHVRSARATGSKPLSQLLSNDKNHSIKIDQLFSPDGDGNKSTTVILSGDSGKGKSFMLQKIMLDWAFGKLYYKNFDVIFLLKCEELKCISEEMSLIELLSWSCSLTSDQISQILHLTPEKVLILIDGTDEYVFHPPSHSMLQLTNPSDRARPMDILRSVLKGILLPESFMLVTTRSIAADAVMNLLKGPQRLTEIMGFSERGVQEYFQKFFQDENLFRKKYERVKTNESLLTACSVPLLCWMVCFCLKKHFRDDDHVIRELKTTTSIYVHFVSTLLEHHDQRWTVLTMLRSLGQLAEERKEKQQVFFDEKSVAKTGLDPATSVFLYKDSLKIKDKQEPVFKFIHLSYQEFFTALYYVLLDKKKSWEKVSVLLNSLQSKFVIYTPSPERRSNPIPSVMMFFCGLLNEKASSSIFQKIKWTVPHTIMLKENLLKSVLTMRKQHGCELFALHCLYELQDEEFVRRALGDWVSIDLSNVSLRSTNCWVLLYCLQCCPHIRNLDLTYCDLTAEKLKILQPVLCMCETLRLSVKNLSEVGDLIQILGKSKCLKKMRVLESENSPESPRWSLDLSVTHGDVLLSLNSSEKKPSFPAVLNISFKCPQSELSSTDWTLFLQRLSNTVNVAKDSSALDEHVSLLLSSFQSVGLKTLDLKLVSLNESWASGIIFLAQTCTSLQQLSVSVTGLLLKEGLKLLEKSLTDPHCTVIIEGRKCSKSTDQCKEQDWSHSCKEKVKIHFNPKVLEKLKDYHEPQAGTGIGGITGLTCLPGNQSNLTVSGPKQFYDPSSSAASIKFPISTLTLLLANTFACDLYGVPRPISSQSPEILEYKTSIIDSCKFVTEYNLLSDECVDLAGHYIEPVIIQRSKEQIEKICRQHVRSVHTSGSKPPSQLSSNDKNQSIRIDQLFSPDSNGKTPRSVIFSGDSGRGKSFMLQKILLVWASGEFYSKQFDVIFLLKCDEVKCLSEKMSLNELLSWSCSLTSNQISELQLTPKTVLILIDGTDEYVSHPPLHFMLLHTDPSKRAPPMVILRKLLRGILLPESFMIVTARSVAADSLMNLKGPQCFTEIMGFSERGVQEYFKKFFKDEQLFRKTFERVKTNESLLTACSVPLLCWMVCFCLKKHFTDDDHVMRELKTTTSIYVHFVSTLLEHHDQSQSVLSLLMNLGQWAERAIQSQQVFFDEKSVAETGLDATIGLFLYKGSLKRKDKQVPMFKFMQFSFQEFFTALYYVLLHG